jgi:hypothetical protein
MWFSSAILPAYDLAQIAQRINLRFFYITRCGVRQFGVER